MDKNKSGGLCLSTVLTIVFVVLKLTHVIDWSWWWVLSPLWIGVVACIVLAVVIAIIERRRTK